MEKTLDKTLDVIGRHWTTLDKTLIFISILFLEASKNAAVHRLVRVLGAI